LKKPDQKNFRLINTNTHTMKHLLISLLLSCAAVSGSAQATLYELWFVADGTQHHALLVADGSDTWVMRVKFYDRSIRGTRLVEQTMAIQYDDQLGAWLNGSNARNAYTNRLADFYVADNFFMLTDEYGDTTMYNVDDQGLKTKVTAQQVSPGQKYKKYREFGW
jgi:hypothetical protein